MRFQKPRVLVAIFFLLAFKNFLADIYTFVADINPVGTGNEFLREFLGFSAKRATAIVLAADMIVSHLNLLSAEKQISFIVRLAGDRDYLL